MGRQCAVESGCGSLGWWTPRGGRGCSPDLGIGLFLLGFRVEGRVVVGLLGDGRVISAKEVVEQGVPCVFPGPVAWQVQVSRRPEQAMRAG